MRLGCLNAFELKICSVKVSGKTPKVCDKLTCSWVSHDLADYKTLQRQPGVFHSVAVELEGEEPRDLTVCILHLAAWLGEKKSNK